MACESTTVLSKDTNLSETIKEIKKLTISGSFNPEIQQIAEKCSLSDDPVKCAFDETYKRIVYEPDPDDRQIIKAVHCSLQSGKGNCVDYSVVLGAILINLNIPFSFKVVSYSNASGYDHIYIRLNDGRILDCVLGQKQDGTDTRENRPMNGQFGSETDYRFKRIFPLTSLEILQGQKRILTGNPMFIQSRVELSRYKLNGGTQFQYNGSAMGRASNTLGASALKITSSPGVTITADQGMIASLSADTDKWGNLKISAPGGYASNAYAKTIFWDGTSLYAVFNDDSGTVYAVNDGTGWKVANAAAYGLAFARTQVTGGGGLFSSPITWIVLAGAGFATWHFGFRKKGKKK